MNDAVFICPVCKHEGWGNHSEVCQFRDMVNDYEEVLADHRRLVRELDVLMNGEEGAAEQASLCDLIKQFPKWKTDLVREIFEDGYQKGGIALQVKMQRAIAEKEQEQEDESSQADQAPS